MTESGGRNGFTVVEVLVAVGLFALLGTGLMLVYRQSMQSYRITTWRQERTRQAEMFWNRLRKPLEEASDALERKDLGPPKWTILKTPRPLLFKPESGDGKIMAWQVDHYDATSGAVNGPFTYAVIRHGHVIELTGPGVGPGAVLEDVDNVVFQATPILQDNTTFEEGLAPPGPPPLGPVPDIVGAVLEITIILAPPPGVQKADLRLPLNTKFKLVVDARPSPAPNY